MECLHTPILNVKKQEHKNLLLKFLIAKGIYFSISSILPIQVPLYIIHIDNFDCPKKYLN